MTIIEPKKVVLAKSRIILQEKIQELFEYGYSGVELSQIVGTPSSTLTGIAKHGESFSVSLEKCEEISESMDSIIKNIKKCES